jgi:ATP-dependent DNA helicase PIF1
MRRKSTFQKPVFGQGYVALSRVRSLAGLKVLGMHPNALQVDPKVVQRDKQFQVDSQHAEETFAALSADDLRNLQTQFVTACGGRLPAADTVILRGTKSVKTRVDKESTLETTLSLIKAGHSVAEIVRQRALAVSTITEHIDKLAAAKALTQFDLERLIRELDPTGAAIPDINEAMSRHGDEKLKPLYEATGERYDYGLIRLVRSLSHLSEI